MKKWFYRHCPCVEFPSGLDTWIENQSSAPKICQKVFQDLPQEGMSLNSVDA